MAANVLDSEAVPAELPHYQLRVALDTNSYQAHVEQRVTVINHGPDTWREVVFHISPAYWSGIFELDRAEMRVSGVSQATTPSLTGTVLRLPFTQPALPGEAVVVDLWFTLKLPRLDPLGWGPTGNTGWGPGIIQMGDWYPALVPYQPGTGWQTWPFTPVGDPVISLPANYDVTIAVSEGNRVAAAGFISESKGEWRYRLAEARAFAFLVSPDFERLAGLAGTIPVQLYVSSAHQASAPEALATAIEAIHLFSDLFGPYPYEELVMAENGFLTSNEYPAMISLSGYAFDAYTNSPASLLSAITVHEVAHQWWYGAVGNDQVNEPWLDEAMAMMSELLFYEHYYPDLTAWWWSFRVDRWQPTGPVDVSIHDFNDSATFIHNMYGRAAHFMRDLRTLMGETAFRAFLRHYYQQNRDQLATQADFFVAVQAHSTADMTRLMEQYFQK
jgi:hypothetical protein